HQRHQLHAPRQPRRWPNHRLEFLTVGRAVPAIDRIPKRCRQPALWRSAFDLSTSPKRKRGARLHANHPAASSRPSRLFLLILLLLLLIFLILVFLLILLLPSESLPRSRPILYNR